jgi:hypothetical protein
VAFRDPVERPVPAARGHLRAVKLLHAVAWALIAGCIALFPVSAWARRFDVAIGLVLLEVLILGANGWRRDDPAELAGSAIVVHSSLRKQRSATERSQP